MRGERDPTPPCNSSRRAVELLPAYSPPCHPPGSCLRSPRCHSPGGRCAGTFNPPQHPPAPPQGLWGALPTAAMAALIHRDPASAFPLAFAPFLPPSHPWGPHSVPFPPPPPPVHLTSVGGGNRARETEAGQGHCGAGPSSGGRSRTAHARRVSGGSLPPPPNLRVPPHPRLLVSPGPFLLLPGHVAHGGTRGCSFPAPIFSPRDEFNSHLRSCWGRGGGVCVGGWGVLFQSSVVFVTCGRN